MKQFEYLPHTADVKIKAYGKTREELFSNVAIGTFNILTDISKVKPKIKKTIKIESKKITSLLYDYLEEFLFLLDTEGFIISKIEKINITEKQDTFELNADISGDSYKNYVTKGDIKAITYHEMEIKDNYIIVVVDV